MFFFIVLYLDSNLFSLGLDSVSTCPSLELYKVALTGTELGAWLLEFHRTSFNLVILIIKLTGTACKHASLLRQFF